MSDERDTSNVLDYTRGALCTHISTLPNAEALSARPSGTDVNVLLLQRIVRPYKPGTHSHEEKHWDSETSRLFVYLGNYVIVSTFNLATSSVSTSAVNYTWPKSRDFS